MTLQLKAGKFYEYKELRQGVENLIDPLFPTPLTKT